MVLLLGAGAPASAQHSGYELAIPSVPSATAGSNLNLSGVAYDVFGLATLRPLSGGAIRVTLEERAPEGRRSVREVVTAETRSSRDGHFEVRLAIPREALRAPQLRVEVSGQQGSREFHLPIGISPSEQVILRTDRLRYEPEDDVHFWGLARDRATTRVLSRQRLQLRVRGPSGAPIFDGRLTTSDGGSASHTLSLPASAHPGSYSAEVLVGQRVVASAAFEVGRRTNERLFVETVLSRSVAAPGEQITARVLVTSPSGTPAAGAQVTLEGGANPVTATTRRDGTAEIIFVAPAFLDADFSQQTIRVTARHSAYGVAYTNASYLLALVPYRVELRSAGGAAVPGVESRAYVLVTTPLGEPAGTGERVRITGDAVVGGRTEVTLEEGGVASFPVRPAPGSAVEHSSGVCAGSQGVSLQVEMLGDSPLVAESCLPVNEDATLTIRTASPLAVPGGEIIVNLERGPDARGVPVMLWLRDGDRLLSSASTRGGRAALSVPEGQAGQLSVVARPILAQRSEVATHEPGDVAFGVGASVSVLVRPADAFAVHMSAGQERYEVREEARVDFRSAAPLTQPAYAAVVARDLAAHSGEIPWRFDWISGAISKAVNAELGQDAPTSLFLEAVMATQSLTQSPFSQSPPLVPHPWYEARPGVGSFRDPMRQASMLRGQQAGSLMVQLENAVSRVLRSNRRERYIRGGRFVPNMLENMRQDRVIGEEWGKTLGDSLVTLAMLQEIQPDFTFETVARRLARRQLVGLLSAMLALTDDNESAQRLIHGVPPSEWLSTLLSEGVITEEQLRDPWGRVFVFRPVRRDHLVLSVRAPTYELFSLGPDGRPETADDVADLFSRLVTANTPYAVASGEDRIMTQLAMVAIGGLTLTRMAEAFMSVSLAMREEQEGYLEADESMGTIGFGSGGGGLGNRLAGGVASRRPSARGRPMEMAEADFADELQPGAYADPQGETLYLDGADDEERSAFEAAEQVIREEFPPTLFFVGEVPLGDGNASLTIPLADALTTYQVEAIAWSQGGWITAAETRIVVDQKAAIDAPTPPFATVGDVLELPLRLENRTGREQVLRFRVVPEEISARVEASQEVTLGPFEARDIPTQVALDGPGAGFLRLEVIDSGGTGVDAIRRPLNVFSNSRLVRETQSFLAESGTSRMTLEVPADATPRGASLLRVVPADLLFGDVLTPLTRGWLARLKGQEVSAESRTLAESILSFNDPRPHINISGGIQTAYALSIVYGDAPEPIVSRAFRALARQSSPLYLRALAPVIRAGGLSPEQQEYVERLYTSAETALQQADAPDVWASSAATLALVGKRTLANELITRAERFLIRLGDEAFLESQGAYGTYEGRITPSADMAIALTSLGRSRDALPFLRHLIALRDQVPAPIVIDPVERLSIVPPMLRNENAAIAAALLAGGRPSELEATFDGVPIALSPEPSGLFLGDLPPLEPGRHRIVVDAAGGPALVIVSGRYGRPWDAPPLYALPAEVEITGEVGAQDTRAGLQVTIRNRNSAILQAPVLELDLPAGAEFEEEARELLRSRLRSDASLDGRSVVLALPPITPGGSITLPLPVQWSVAGTLVGLGATLYDSASTGPTRRAVLPADVLVIPRAGQDPEFPSDAATAPPDPPPPPRPLPEPFPIDRLDPVATTPRACEEASCAA